VHQESFDASKTSHGVGFSAFQEAMDNGTYLTRKRAAKSFVVQGGGVVK